MSVRNISAADLARVLTGQTIPADASEDLAVAYETAETELADVQEAAREAYRTVMRDLMGALPGTHRAERRAERAVSLIIETAVRAALEAEIETGEQIRADG